MTFKLFNFFFMLHLCVNIEKYVFINEIHSLLGFVYFLVIFKKNSIEVVGSKLNCFLLFYWLYTSMHFLSVFLFVPDIGLQAARTFPLYYSFYSIFLGVYLYRNKNTFLRINSPLISWFAVFAGGVLSNTVAVLLTYKKEVSLKVIIPLGALVIYKNMFMSQGSSTMVVNLLLFLSIVFFRGFTVSVLSKLVSLRLIYIISILLISTLISIYPSLSDLASGGLFGYEEMDPNNIWRILFWSQILHQIWLDGNIVFGMGLGWPLFDYFSLESKFLIDASPDDSSLAYTLGMHNSYFYILARYGVVGYTLLLTSICIVLKKCIMVTKFEGIDGVFTCALLFMLINAFFNVIIESPLYSSIFWIVLGYCICIRNKITDIDTSLNLDALKI